MAGSCSANRRFAFSCFSLSLLVAGTFGVVVSQSSNLNFNVSSLHMSAGMDPVAVSVSLTTMPESDATCFLYLEGYGVSFDKCLLTFDLKKGLEANTFRVRALPYYTESLLPRKTAIVTRMICDRPSYLAGERGEIPVTQDLSSYKLCYVGANSITPFGVSSPVRFISTGDYYLVKSRDLTIQVRMQQVSPVSAAVYAVFVKTARDVFVVDSTVPDFEQSLSSLQTRLQDVAVSRSSDIINHVTYSFVFSDDSLMRIRVTPAWNKTVGFISVQFYTPAKKLFDGGICGCVSCADSKQFVTRNGNTLDFHDVVNSSPASPAKICKLTDFFISWKVPTNECIDRCMDGKCLHGLVKPRIAMNECKIPVATMPPKPTSTVLAPLQLPTMFTTTRLTTFSTTITTTVTKSNDFELRPVITVSGPTTTMTNSVTVSVTNPVTVTTTSTMTMTSLNVLTLSTEVTKTTSTTLILPTTITITTTALETTTSVEKSLVFITNTASPSTSYITVSHTMTETKKYTESRNTTIFLPVTIVETSTTVSTITSLIPTTVTKTEVLDPLIPRLIPSNISDTVMGALNTPENTAGVRENFVPYITTIVTTSVVTLTLTETSTLPQSNNNATPTSPASVIGTYLASLPSPILNPVTRAEVALPGIFSTITQIPPFRLPPNAASMVHAPLPTNIPLDNVKTTKAAGRACEDAFSKLPAVAGVDRKIYVDDCKSAAVGMANSAPICSASRDAYKFASFLSLKSRTRDPSSKPNERKDAKSQLFELNFHAPNAPRCEGNCSACARIHSEASDILCKQNNQTADVSSPEIPDFFSLKNENLASLRQEIYETPTANSENLHLLPNDIALPLMENQQTINFANLHESLKKSPNSLSQSSFFKSASNSKSEFELIFSNLFALGHVITLCFTFFL